MSSFHCVSASVMEWVSSTRLVPGGTTTSFPLELGVLRSWTWRDLISCSSLWFLSISAKSAISCSFLSAWIFRNIGDDAKWRHDENILSWLKKLLPLPHKYLRYTKKKLIKHKTNRLIQKKIKTLSYFMFNNWINKLMLTSSHRFRSLQTPGLETRVPHFSPAVLRLLTSSHPPLADILGSEWWEGMEW